MRSRRGRWRAEFALMDKCRASRRQSARDAHCIAWSWAHIRRAMKQSVSVVRPRKVIGSFEEHRDWHPRAGHTGVGPKLVGE